MATNQTEQIPRGLVICGWSAALISIIHDDLLVREAPPDGEAKACWHTAERSTSVIPCLILGDSIAVGVGQARPECVVAAEIGITSDRYLKASFPTQHADTAVISLGVNDGKDAQTEANLRRLRGTVSVDHVYWLLSGIHPWAREAAMTVAKEHCDDVIDVAPLTGPDHLHPDRAGYARLAAETRRRPAAETPRQIAYKAFQPPALLYRAVPTVRVTSFGGFRLRNRPVELFVPNLPHR